MIVLAEALMLIALLSLLLVGISAVRMPFLLERAAVGDLAFYLLFSMCGFVLYFCLLLSMLSQELNWIILPLNIKSLAGSVATLANWLMAWVVTMTANLLLNWSTAGTFTIYTAVTAFSLVFVTLWVPETRGRTLEEIQWSFR